MGPPVGLLTGRWAVLRIAPGAAVSVACVIACVASPVVWSWGVVRFEARGAGNVPHADVQWAVRRGVLRARGSAVQAKGVPGARQADGRESMAQVQCSVMIKWNCSGMATSVHSPQCIRMQQC